MTPMMTGETQSMSQTYVLSVCCFLSLLLLLTARQLCRNTTYEEVQLHYSEEELGRAAAPPSSLLAVPNVTCSNGHGTVCHQRLGPAPHFRLSAVYSDGQQTSALSCATFRCSFCKVPPQLCDGSTIIHDILVVVVVTAQPSTASVPTSYYSMWHYNYLYVLKG